MPCQKFQSFLIIRQNQKAITINNSHDSYLTVVDYGSAQNLKSVPYLHVLSKHIACGYTSLSRRYSRFIAASSLVKIGNKANCYTKITPQEKTKNQELH